MLLSNFLSRLVYLDFLIRTKASGDINTFAKKLNLSRAGAYKLLNELKDLGFPIAYSKKDHHYYYTCEGKLVKRLFEKDEDVDDDQNTYGGGVIIF